MFHNINKDDWFKAKGYAHFTSKIDRKFADSYVKNYKSVKEHAFYPLIHIVLKVRRYKKISDHVENKPRAHSYKSTNGKYVKTAKERKIFYANHLDTQIYSFYAKEILGKKYEKYLENKEVSNSITAYRKIQTNENPEKNKSNIHFAKDVFDFIKEKGDCVAIAFDISAFFDSLDHEILKNAWLDLLNKDSLVNYDKLPDDHYNIYKSLTNFSYVNLKDILEILKIGHPNEVYRKKIHEYFKSRKDFNAVIRSNNLIKKHPFKDPIRKVAIGIPQGTPISAFLANLYLLKFDEQVFKVVKELGALYRRYSDDLVVVCSENQMEFLKDYIISLIKNEFKLTIQKEKTQLNYFYRDDFKIKVFQIENGRVKPNIPFQYLGFEFNGKNVYIKSTSVAKYYRQLKKFINKKIKLAKKEKKFKFTSPQIHKRVFKRKIYKMFTYLGTNGTKRNYILYANEASEIFNEITIKKQLKKHWNKANLYLKRKIQINNIAKFNKRTSKASL